MTSYFFGTSDTDIDPPPPPDGIQTLYLMNPSSSSYFLPPSYSTATTPFLSPHYPLLPAGEIPHSRNFWWPHITGDDESAVTVAASSSSGPPAPGDRDLSGLFPPARQGLSLSLYPDDQQHGIDERVSVVDGGERASVITAPSKYMKAVQELLDEIASTFDVGGADGGGYNDGVEGWTTTTGRYGEGEVTAAEREESGTKKAKLLHMLDEVEHRHKEYHERVQLTVTSFEHAAGTGAARSYTWLALKTMSRQFRCLKDAIIRQIKAVEKSSCEASSKTRNVDHQLSQQRAFHHMGTTTLQNNPWRPQRGLPQPAVSVLRAWLFEHFLHPYPKDSDKHMLAKQTGLTRSQVSNWFINARVRLWKPMVEEMYAEETNSAAKDTTPHRPSVIRTTAGDDGNNTGRGQDDVIMSFGGERLISDGGDHHAAYPTPYRGNGAVSLTLGLPDCGPAASYYRQGFHHHDGGGEADFCGIGKTASLLSQGEEEERFASHYHHPQQLVSDLWSDGNNNRN